MFSMIPSCLDIYNLLSKQRMDEKAIRGILPVSAHNKNKSRREGLGVVGGGGGKNRTGLKNGHLCVCRQKPDWFEPQERWIEKDGKSCIRETFPPGCHSNNNFL